MSRRDWKPRPFPFKCSVWRKLVYARDDWTCRYPGCGMGTKSFPFRRIEAHHILMWEHHPASRFDVNNGITLCVGHHTIVTGHEGDFVRVFQDELRRRGVLWTARRQVAEKCSLGKMLRSRRRARTAAGPSRRRRSSRTARRN